MLYICNFCCNFRNFLLLTDVNEWLSYEYLDKSTNILIFKKNALLVDSYIKLQQKLQSALMANHSAPGELCRKLHLRCWAQVVAVQLRPASFLPAWSRGSGSCSSPLSNISIQLLDIGRNLTKSLMPHNIVLHIPLARMSQIGSFSIYHSWITARSTSPMHLTCLGSITQVMDYGIRVNYNCYKRSYKFEKYANS
jgi:hypothetical protein